METRDLIVVEQARFLHRNTPPAVIGGTFVVATVVAVFWRVVPEQHLLGWLGAVVLLGFYRMGAWHAYRKREFSLAAARDWVRHAFAGALFSGCAWGAGAFFLLPPGETGYQLMFLWAVSMMAVGA